MTKTTDAPKLNIFQRMNKVMDAINYVAKEKPDGLKYSVVTHDKVTALVREHFVTHGIVAFILGGSMKVEQSGNTTQTQFTVRFQNIDDPEDYMDVDTLGQGVDPQDKGPGKAMSYGVKYAYLKALGLETGDDPDLTQDDRARRRSTIQQKADGYITTIQRTVNGDDLLAFIATAEFIETMNGLRTQDPATLQMVQAETVAAAKRIGVELPKKKQADA